jgi:hypothetical protein
MSITKNKKSRQVGSAVQAVAAAAIKYKRTLERRWDRRYQCPGSRLGSRTRIRKRRTVEEVFEILGDQYFKRAFRMSYRSFKKLARVLKGHIISASKKYPTRTRHCPNGPIFPDLRLACALRYFAGGLPLDIMGLLGVGHSDVLDSVWHVVDAANRHPDFKLEYPASAQQQASIAAEFLSKSAAGFDCCAGAIDGILIWIHCPTEKECKKLGVASGKFFCARKNKFGLNCQAVSDARGRILDISIVFPGTTSDVLSFEGSTLFQRLEAGLLSPDLCLFGDNAYLNTTYMATPYAGVSLDVQRDAYNFYHSQLRIRVECSFGILTERWSILRRAMPCNITVQKTIAMVCALARLNNFCINETEISPSPLAALDAQFLETSGGCPLVERSNVDQAAPMQLIGGGHHFDDLNRHQRRSRHRSQQRDIRHGIPASGEQVIPRERLLAIVMEQGLVRPTPTTRRVA